MTVVDLEIEALADEALPEYMAAFREPDRHIFMIGFIADILE